MAPKVVWPRLILKLVVHFTMEVGWGGGSIHYFIIRSVQSSIGHEASVGARVPSDLGENDFWLQYTELGQLQH